jgi:hypothetical protein
MRQAMTAEVRPDEGQATSSGASGRSADDLLADTSQRRSNFFAARLDRTENRL